MVLFYLWPQGGTIGAMIQYVIQILMENLWTKFHSIKDDRIAEISCYNVTLVPPLGRMYYEILHTSVRSPCAQHPKFGHNPIQYWGIIDH